MVYIFEENTHNILYYWNVSWVSYSHPTINILHMIIHPTPSCWHAWNFCRKVWKCNCLLSGNTIKTLASWATRTKVGKSHLDMKTVLRQSQIICSKIFEGWISSKSMTIQFDPKNLATKLALFLSTSCFGDCRGWLSLSGQVHSSRDLRFWSWCGFFQPDENDISVKSNYGLSQQNLNMNLSPIWIWMNLSPNIIWTWMYHQR